MKLGHRFLVATDQQALVQDYTALLRAAKVDQSIPVADRLLHCYGANNHASLASTKASPAPPTANSCAFTCPPS